MNRTSDVVVIGGGVIGSAVACFAAWKGLSVTLIDQPRRGRATSASAGGLWPIGETVGVGCGVIFHKASSSEPSKSLPEALPDAFFQFAIASNAMFPGVSTRLREETGIDVEWEQTSLLFVTYDESDLAFARGIREKLGVDDRRTSWLTPEDLAREEPAVTRENRGAIVFLGDDQINPYRLADAFQASARLHGARIFRGSEVRAIRTRHGRVEGVETRDGFLGARHVVNAAGAWAGEVGCMVGLEIPVKPIRGQILGTETLPKTLKACISTSDCYLAQKGHGEIVIGSSTEDVGFDTGITPSVLQNLAAGAVRAIPRLESTRLKRCWSGFRPGTPDELPILGPVDGIEGYLNACGHFRTGILNSPLTGRVLAELAAGEDPSWPIDGFLFDRFRPSIRAEKARPQTVPTLQG